MYGGKAVSNKGVFIFLRMVTIVSNDLIVIGSLYQIVGAATEKACLPVFSFILVAKRYFETDDLRSQRNVAD